MKARLDSYLRTAETIIASYDGSVPFHHYIRKYFAEHKKHGSKDRKLIGQCCFCYFRLGRSMNSVAFSEKTMAGLFLCNDEPGIWRELYNDEYLNNWKTTLQFRVQLLQTKYPQFEAENIYPYIQNTSVKDKLEFNLSHLIQPLLFLRARPNKLEKILHQLQQEQVPFQQLQESCIALANNTKVEDVITINKDAVVQDYSSQRTGDVLKKYFAETKGLKVWDCCAASGGKSIMAYDVLENIQLTVSDVRPSIIENLRKRFKEAGIANYNSFIADLSNSISLPKQKFDLIICDAPCSGSGTWGRTPEQLVFFEESKINHYSTLQKNIGTNIAKCLAENGSMLYITCSVFIQENEEVVTFLQQHCKLDVLHSELIEGFTNRADTMFVALLTASKP